MPTEIGICRPRFTTSPPESSSQGTPRGSRGSPYRGSVGATHPGREAYAERLTPSCRPARP
eukprot:scaffold33106_cov70-Phaeocystis_antarctica.AAC.5